MLLLLKKEVELCKLQQDIREQVIVAKSARNLSKPGEALTPFLYWT